MTPKRIRFTQLARENPGLQFNALMGQISDPEELLASFHRQDGNKASGVDGIKKADYGEALEEHLADLSGRIRRLAYRPQPVRRVYIPKGDGRRRPLGIPSFEDRLVQDQLSQILQAIWEPEFRDCSFGFRPGRSTHGALRRVSDIIWKGNTQWVVEADIKGFFDHVDHDHLMRFLGHRIADPNLLRLIRRFLKAGHLEDGVFHAGDQGTPQGGLVSPVLSNIYLHYVLDLWFEKRFMKSCGGRGWLVRYADDFIACFEKEGDARRFMEELPKRLAQFALEVAPEKTRIVPFGRKAYWRQQDTGERQAVRSFYFLGFTHYMGKSRRGGFKIGRRTERKRFSRKLKALNERLRGLRVKGGAAMVEYVYRHLQGHIRYYGVSGNGGGVHRYIQEALRLLFKWLNRRSQRRSVTWEQYRQWIARRMPKARIIHNFYAN